MNRRSYLHIKEREREKKLVGLRKDVWKIIRRVTLGTAQKGSISEARSEKQERKREKREGGGREKRINSATQRIPPISLPLLRAHNRTVEVKAVTPTRGRSEPVDTHTRSRNSIRPANLPICHERAVYVGRTATRSDPIGHSGRYDRFSCRQNARPMRNFIARGHE